MDAGIELILSLMNIKMENGIGLGTSKDEEVNPKLFRLVWICTEADTSTRTSSSAPRLPLALLRECQRLNALSLKVKSQGEL